MQFTIQAATRADLPVVLQLVRELARFERLEHEVEATVEGMEEDFFGPRAIAGALLSKVGEQVTGFALYFFTFSTFVGRRGLWLEDLYVRPAFRKHGIGRALIKAVGR